jgi:hypothetical protein
VAAAVPARPARGGTAAVEGGEARIAALERLARLRDAGVIDDAELAREKRRLLE